MKPINHGGPAFPVPMIQHQGGYENVPDAGMSRRDYFAAHAPAMPAGWTGGEQYDTIGRLRADHALHAAVEWRWYYADQMIKVANRLDPLQEPQS